MMTTMIMIIMMMTMISISIHMSSSVIGENAPVGDFWMIIVMTSMTMSMMAMTMVMVVMMISIPIHMSSSVIGEHAPVGNPSVVDAVKVDAVLGDYLEDGGDGGDGGDDVVGDRVHLNTLATLI